MFRALESWYKKYANSVSGCMNTTAQLQICIYGIVTSSVSSFSSCFSFCQRHVAQLTAPKIEQRPGWQIVSNGQTSAQLHTMECIFVSDAVSAFASTRMSAYVCACVCDSVSVMTSL